MENTFKLSVTPNYGKVIWRVVALFVGAILPIVLFGISLANGWLNPDKVKFEVVLPAYLVFVMVATFLVIRKTFFKDTITLAHTSLEIPKMSNIDYSEITKNKAMTVRGFTSYIITLNDGKKVAFGPTNNYSAPAEEIFRDFIAQLEDKVDGRFKQPRRAEKII